MLESRKQHNCSKKQTSLILIQLGRLTRSVKAIAFGHRAVWQMFFLLLAEPEVDEVCTAKCFSMDWLHSCEFCLDLCVCRGCFLMILLTSLIFCSPLGIPLIYGHEMQHHTERSVEIETTEAEMYTVLIPGVGQTPRMSNLIFYP